MDFLEGALPPPPTYEAQCSEFEDIMRFITYGNAAKLKLQNPLAKHFGVVHTCAFRGGPVQSPKYYQFGAYLIDDQRDVFDEKLTRLFTAVNSRTEVFVSLQQQWTRKFLTWTKAEIKNSDTAQWCSTATYRGDDFALVTRAATGPLVHCSYNQRITPWLNVGGEVKYSQPDFNRMMSIAEGAATTKQQRPSTKPFAYVIGATIKSGIYTTLLELDQSRPDGALVHMSVKQDITDNSKVAASMSFFPEKMASSVEAGYSVRLPRTKSTVKGAIQSDGTFRGYFERTLLSTVHLSLTAHGNFFYDMPAKFGVQLLLGHTHRPEKAESRLLTSHHLFNS